MTTHPNPDQPVFSEGDFLKGTLTWGWQCFTCRAEETGFESATRAREHADNHEALAEGGHGK